MTRFPQFEVAISDAERAEIEAIFIELMRVRDADAQISSEATASPRIDPREDFGTH